MHLTIYIDFKSPGSYLSLKPTLGLLDRHDITVKWLPFRTKQETIPAQHADETVGDTHRRVRAKSRRDTHLLYAKAREIPMIFPAKPGETDSALAALLTVKNDPLPFIQAAYDAYWIKHADLNNGDVVSKMLTEVNADCSNQNHADQLQKLEICLKEAEESGIVDAPAFVIDGQMFIGREHLPWIESIIES